jgi:hypothetical protein
MSDNSIYQAPAAELAVDTSDTEPFFAVGVKKLVLMHIFTYGMYDVYWFYRHFKHQKLKNNEDTWPAVRGVFFLFFIYSLFGRINDAAIAQDGQQKPGLRSLAGLWLLLILASFLTTMWATIAGMMGGDPAGLARTLTPVSTVLSLVGLIVPAFFISKAQRVANTLLPEESVSNNSTLTAANFAWILLGLLYLFITIANVFVATQALNAAG